MARPKRLTMLGGLQEARDPQGKRRVEAKLLG
jgi:hypothetical protein